MTLFGYLDRIFIRTRRLSAIVCGIFIAASVTVGYFFGRNLGYVLWPDFPLAHDLMAFGFASCGAALAAYVVGERR